MMSEGYSCKKQNNALFASDVPRNVSHFEQNEDAVHAEEFSAGKKPTENAESLVSTDIHHSE